MSEAKSKKKIAVLGGGMAAMTTAFWLTEKEGWQDEYEITIYQMGWRLGGKAVSGRDVRPGYGHRIQEHGLFILLGLYENTFKTYRRVLEQLGKIDPPPVETFRTWDEALKRDSIFTAPETLSEQWWFSALLFPENDGVPGDGGEINLWDMVQDLIGWIETAHGNFFTPPAGTSDQGDSPQQDRAGCLGRTVQWMRRISTVLGSMLRGVGEGVAETSSEASQQIRGAVRHAAGLPPDTSDHAVEDHGILVDLIRGFLDGVYSLVKDDLDDLRTYEFWVLMDLAGTTVIGILEDRLLTRGLEAADDLDWRDWLKKHGAKAETLASSPVRNVYDIVFGFEQGVADEKHYNFVAGTCTRMLLRMLFTYRGAFLYKFQSGVGDVLFTPFYGLLRSRGVKFEFFHRVEKIQLDPRERHRIGKIRIARQVRLKDEAGGYRPLIRVGGMDCWPGQPDYDQIENGEALKEDPLNPGHPYDLESYWTSWQDVEQRVLRYGEDFDQVVLGIPVVATPEMCEELIAAEPRWHAMFYGKDGRSGLTTVQSQNLQLWLDRSLEELGWERPEWIREREKELGRSLGQGSMMGGYVEPINTWADLSLLLPREQWPEHEKPESISYFAGPFESFPGDHPPTDHEFPAMAQRAVTEKAIAHFKQTIGPMWPKATLAGDPASLDPALLHDPENRQGDSRYDAQYFWININPTDRYVQSPQGSTSLRIKGDESGFENLYLVGDWTYNSVLNVGCLEAAAVSAMRTAQAICGCPQTIIGDTDT